jgi:hypothetical protein
VPAGRRVQFGLKLDAWARLRGSKPTRLKHMIFEDGIFLVELRSNPRVIRFDSIRFDSRARDNKRDSLA